MMAVMSVAGQVAVKTNVVYDATSTLNLGVEVRTGNRSTVNLVGGLNPWTFNDGRKAKHWVLMPEYRWWLCTPFGGHFLGVHALGGQMNVGRVSLPVPGYFFGGENLTAGARHSRYQGYYAGVGLTYGYQYPLSRHWNLEAEIGAGYGHVWYDKFNCGHCGRKVADGGSNYVGVTKVGLSIMYIF